MRPDFTNNKPTKNKTMDKNIKPIIIIQFMDGTREDYEFDEPTIDPLTFAAKLAKAVSCQEIIIQLADRLRILPKHGIKSLEFKFPSSAKMKLPDFTFCNARPVGGTPANEPTRPVLGPAIAGKSSRSSPPK